MNFVNCDAPYNAELYVEGHPETEIATMGCVESSEIIDYKINGEEYIETFRDAYNRVLKMKDSVAYSENSDYIDVSELNITVKDSVNGFVKVKKFIKNHNVNNFNRVKFSAGYSLTATSDHPLPILQEDGSTVRTFVKDIKVGDKVRVSVDNKIESDKVFKTKCFGDNTYSLGLAISDFFNDYGSIADVDNAEEVFKDYLEYIEEMDEKNINDASKELMELFGSDVSEIHIPSELLTCSRKQRVAMLAALVNGSGYVMVHQNMDGELESFDVELSVYNKALAMTTLALIRGLGYKANFNVDYMDCTEYTISFRIPDDTNRTTYYEFEKIAEVISITPGCEEGEIDGISYDLETESDRLDISFIQSHNCRTRVSTNKHDPDKAVIPGRGNLSFTSINLPRLAIKACGDVDLFFKLLDEKLELVHRQLLERFELQCKKHPINYPFLMGQGVWLGSDHLGPNDDIREILKHGTLGVGFIGLAETLVALTGKHHGESEEAQELGLKIVKHMREYTDAWSDDEHMNYGVIGTPAEGLSGRFIRMDKKLFGTIPGVTDKDYYTNSSHVPVSFPISAFKKVDIESPYHVLENGGHILYIEISGDPTQNLKAFKNIVRYMHDKNAGYMALNHSVDRDSICGFVGIINDECPRCGRKDGEPMTMEMWNKIKGYANAGNADTLGYHGDPYEEADRLPNN